LSDVEGPRLLRSGLVLFVSRLLSVVTGLAFTLLVTRNTTKAEYGVWVNVTADIIAYFTLLASALPFWVMRFVARKHEGSAKTGVVANLLLGAVSAVIYVFIAPFIVSWLNVDVEFLPLYVIASAQVVQLYLLNAFEAVLRVVNIEALGYGLLIEELVKVGLAYLLIVYFGLGLFGAMTAIIFACFIQILYYLRISWGSLRGSINWAYVKEWLKGSLVNIYNVVGVRIAAFGLILLFVMSGEVARAYYGASYQIASIIGYSVFLAYALYPRLLMREDSRDVSESFKLFFMFSIPMTVGAIVLADSLLAILGEKHVEGRDTFGYVAAVPVLQLVCLSVFLSSFSQVLESVIFGAEKFDLEAKISLKKLVRTKLFIIFSIPYIGSLIILPSTYIMLLRVGGDPLAAAFYTVFISFITRSLFLAFRCALAKKTSTFVFPWKNAIKYLFASGVMAVFLLLIPHPARISTTFAYVVLGGIVYLLVLVVVDKDSRTFVKSIIKEIRGIKSRRF